jgi:hypothetical protein
MQTRDSGVHDNSRFASITGRRESRRNQTILATKNEEEIGLYNSTGTRKNARGGRLERCQPSHITNGHRKPPAKARKPQGTEVKTHLHRRQTEDSFPRHLKQIRRVLLHLRETAAEARRNMDQIRRLIFDADVIENSMQHLVQEQIFDTEDED